MLNISIVCVLQLLFLGRRFAEAFVLGGEKMLRRVLEPLFGRGGASRLHSLPVRVRYTMYLGT